MARILIVDDDPQAIDRLQQLLGDEHELASTGDWTQVSRLFFQRPCDLVLMDVNLPGSRATN
ncbi:MAG: response regulator [Planctomycetota bacterium]